MLLIVDCYLDESGGTSNFARQLGTRSWHSIRPTRAPLPEVDTSWKAVFVTGSGACLADGYEGSGLRTGWMQELVQWVREVVEADIPLLGVCFGHQVLGAAFGGGVRKGDPPEVGFKDIHIIKEDPLLKPLSPSFSCFVSHEDEIAEAGALDILAYSADCAIQAVRVPGYSAWGVQFHAEMLLEEVRALLSYRKSKHHRLNIDIEAECQKSLSAPKIAPLLFGRFLELVDEHHAQPV